MRRHDGVATADRIPPHPGALLGLLLVLAILSLASPAFGLEQELTAADGAAGDGLGWSVAIDGDTLVVGAPFDDASRGAVYVYGRSGGDWAQTAKLTASDGAPDDSLGYSVGIDGDTIVAGAAYDDAPMDVDAGSVYTFARDGATGRTETAKLTLVDPVLDENLGFDVGIDGDTIVAGAPGDFVGANSEQGSAYTFARTGAPARTETARLTASDGGMVDRLGRSVGIDGDTIVAGAPFDDIAANSDQGSAYTFVSTGGDRTQTAKLTASDGGLHDELGFAVAIDGDTIVAGLGGDGPGPVFGRGSAYTFARTGGDRTQTAKLIASDGAAGDLLGEAVAIAADTIVVGARFDDVGAIGEEGSAYTFARGGAAVRTETSRLDAADGEAGDEFGFSVAVDADTILVGARRDTIGANANQGSASVFFSAGTDMTPPKTKGLKGPKKVERGERVRFRFKSTEPDSTFSCRLDRKKYKACRSPKRVRTSKLKPGGHSFSVFATDAAGNADPSPAKVRFKVVGGHRGK